MIRNALDDGGCRITAASAQKCGVGIPTPSLNKLRRPTSTTRTSPPRAQALVGGSAAAIVAGLGMLLLRSTLEVRSVPERVLESLLLLLPTSVVEGVLQRFGFDAKRYGLEAAILGLLTVLAALGYGVLQARWPLAMLPAVGVALWLVVMVVIMPLTAAGFFAMGLESGKGAAIGGYLAVGLSYAAVLVLAREWIATAQRGEREPMVSADFLGLDTVGRRAAIGLTAASLVAFVSAYASAFLFTKRSAAPSILILDPQEPVPSGGLDVQNPHPHELETAQNVPTALPVSGPTGPDAEPPAREVARDKDGAVVRSGREPGQLAAPINSNADFYVVTKNAGGDPVLHPQDWRLLVDGEVDRTFQLDYATLRKLPAIEVTKTLECISNFVGKPELAPFGAELISTATFKGARVGDILQLTGGPISRASWLAVLSADEYTSALPLDAALDPATLLVYEMNGQVLPREHGYPARLLVPGRYGMKNPKWVIGLRPMPREFTDWYGQRNWSKTGIVRTMSRIDSPAPGATLAAGSNMVAGIAYGGSRGVQSVEFSADGGNTWAEATILEPAPGQDRWVRWQASFTLAVGVGAKLVARATDGSAAVQVQPFSLPEPDGGTGWPSIDVKAGS